MGFSRIELHKILMDFSALMDTNEENIEPIELQLSMACKEELLKYFIQVSSQSLSCCLQEFFFKDSKAFFFLYCTFG